MDPTLSILDRALKGDAGALSFLVRTASIYVYDCTNTNPQNNQPKICGAWDFLNQALTEVDRYESRMLHAQAQGHHHVIVSLEAHLQLLATMSSRAARRCPVADQNLVEVCLSNAAHFHEHGSNEHARNLIQLNQQMRDRVMGRIATITFDFTNHRRNSNAKAGYQTAFSNPITMDSLCAIVAANAISIGPHEFSSLVLEWIVPSVNNMPPFSVAAVIYHLASESMGKSAPGGTKDALKKLLDPVLSKILAPLLQEAVRESDHGDTGIDMIADESGDRAQSHRIAAMTLKALERWCAATACNIGQVKQTCRKVNIDIIAVISDAMYSDSELVMDALSGLLDTLLRQHAKDESALKGLSIMQGVAAASFGSPDNLLQLEKDLATEAQGRDEILSELVSAIGLQRFRFSSRLSNGDSGVCRCLTNIARSIADASRSLLKSGKLQGAENGMITLLMKATSHPSLNVYSIALDAFNFCISAKTDLPTRLLPILQGKAIAPPSLVGLSSDVDVDIDFHEFERFREHQLTEILSNCYINCRPYYMESCCIAIEEFCSGNPNPHTAYQLEAALFCLCAVSVDASKRALLVNASPAAQAAAAKACASQISGPSTANVAGIGEDAKHHDEKLSRCILAVSNCQSISSFNNPLFLSQLCRLLGKYANWLSKTPSEGVFDAAARLALSCFNEAASKFGQNSEISFEMAVSPFTESVSALRNILSWAPTRFANADALSTLENGWRSIYSSTAGDSSNIPYIEDTKALCTGITRVLAALPPDQWALSLATLAGPTIECIETVLESIGALQGSQDQNALDKRISRMSGEICVIATILRTFHGVAKKQRNINLDEVRTPLLSLLHRVWPCLTHIAKTFSTHEIVISSLSEFLLMMISLNDQGKEVSLLKEASDIAIVMMDAVSRQQSTPCNITPIMDFVEEMIQIFGFQAEARAKASLSAQTDGLPEHIHAIIGHLLQKAFHVIREQSEKSNIDALPGLFSVCRACIRNCPLLFINLHVFAESSNSESIFSGSLNASISFVNNRQIDVVRAALLYINDTFVLVREQPDESLTKIKEVVDPLRGNLIATLINSSCGVFPREVLDPAGNLLHSILRSTDASHAEQACTQALQSEAFQLGGDAKRAILLTLGKGAQGTIASSVIMDLLDDLWTLHQNDVTGGNTTGGDAILSFTKKYSR